MTSSFWVGDGAGGSDPSAQSGSTGVRKPTIRYAEDLEAILLESLSANLYSFAGLDVYTRQGMKRRQEASTAFHEKRRMESCTPQLPAEHASLPLSIELLPIGHPVRIQIEEIVQATGLPRAAPLLHASDTVAASAPHSTSMSVPSESTSSSLASGGNMADTENSNAHNPRGKASKLHMAHLGEMNEESVPPPFKNQDDDQHIATQEDAKEKGKKRALGRGHDSEESAPAVKVATPQSALARLVAQAKGAAPASQMDSNDSSSEEEEEMGLTSSSHCLSSRNLQRDHSFSTKATSSAVGMKRTRSTSLLFQGREDGRDDKQKKGEERAMMDNEKEETTFMNCSANLDRKEKEEGRTENEASPTEDVSSTPASVPSKHPSQMSREEFLSQFKRAPRRGEIGLSAEEIGNAEALGYVMSGSRSKAAHMFVDRVQRQLHERDAANRELQFRQVEDERSNTHLIEALAKLVKSKVSGVDAPKRET